VRPAWKTAWAARHPPAGPVFSVASNNRVTAKGINLAIDFSDNYYMTIDWVSADFKVTVNTG
jgi:hypothetical protein